MIVRIWRALIKKWWQITVPMRLRAQGVKLGRDIRFYGMPIVSMANGSEINIGDRVVLCSDSRFTALGVNHPVVLRTLSADAKIVIGKDCGISGASICAAISIEIGRECLIGANVSIFDTDFHSVKPNGRRFNNDAKDIASSSVHIGNNVFLGKDSSIMKGVAIGENSIIGANSVVVNNVISNSICAGNPAKMIRVFQ